MATPLQVAQTIVDAVPSLTTLQRLRIRNQWTLAWDNYLVQSGHPTYYKAGWEIHHWVEYELSTRGIIWTTLAERARARWEENAESDPRENIWNTAQRFVLRDTVRAVLCRDTVLDRVYYNLLTAAWRDRFPGFDA